MMLSAAGRHDDYLAGNDDSGVVVSRHTAIQTLPELIIAIRVSRGDVQLVELNHQPVEYDCPFCRLVVGEDLPGNYSKQADVIFRDDVVTAFVSSAWWPANPGHVLVVPNDHYENIYDIPDEVLGAVQVVGKRMALALEATYGCDGTSFRQHNRPGGNQEVWHYHLHVFPRYRDDELYIRTRERRFTVPAERIPYAQKLRQYLAQC